MKGGGYGSTSEPTKAPKESSWGRRVVALCLVCAAGAAATLGGPGATAKLTVMFEQLVEGEYTGCGGDDEDSYVCDDDNQNHDDRNVEMHRHYHHWNRHHHHHHHGKGDFYDDDDSNDTFDDYTDAPTDHPCYPHSQLEDGECVCDPGYHLENGKCKENQCTCAHGSAPMGRDCHSKEPESFCCEQDGKKKCMSCACNGCDVSCHMDDNMVCTCDD